MELITPEFRKPLLSVANYSGQLEDNIQEAQTDDELKESLQGIQQSSIRLNSLIEDFIALAELKTGEAQMAYDIRAQEITNIGILQYEAGQIYTNRLNDSNIQIHCQLNDNLPAVMGDRERLMVCTRRILDFGITKMHSNQTSCNIYLKTEQRNGTVQSFYQFPGHLDAATLNILNQHFFENNIDDLDIALRIPGLSIVKGYVDLHHGDLSVETQPDRFQITITLPVATR